MSVKPGIPATPPAKIIGTAYVLALHAEGYRIVPAVATTAMKEAAARVLQIKHTMGLPWVSVHEKAAIRWEAMLAAWPGDYAGLAQGRQVDRGAVRTKRWRFTKWLGLEIGWIAKRGGMGNG